MGEGYGLCERHGEDGDMHARAGFGRALGDRDPKRSDPIHDHGHRRSRHLHRLAELRDGRRRFVPGSAVPDRISTQARRCGRTISTKPCPFPSSPPIARRSRWPAVRPPGTVSARISPPPSAAGSPYMRGPLTVVAAVAVVSLFTLSSAGSPIPLAASMAAQTAVPPAAAPIDDPAAGVPVAPMVFPPPAAAPEPAPEVAACARPRSHGDHARCRCTRGNPGRRTRAARGDAPCGTPSRPAACPAPTGCALTAPGARS